MPSWLCLSRLVFEAGCGTRLYRLLIVAFCLLFTVNLSSGPSPTFEKWSGHGTPKAFPECRKYETGRAREGSFPLSEGGSGDLARERFGFRKAVDAFYCILSAISVYKFSQFCRYVGRNITH